MKIKIENNIAEIWYTSESPQEELELLVKSLRRQHYTVVVFKSGKKDLASLTSELLRINKY